MTPLYVERVDELLSRLAPPPPLAPSRVARIRDRIESVPPSRFVAQRLAIALVITLVCVGSALAMYRRRAAEPHVPVPALRAFASDSEPPADIPMKLTARMPAPVVVATEPTERAAPTVPTLAANEVVAPNPMGASDVAAPQTSATSESVLAAEARLLATALRQLRQDHDPRKAIATLDALAAQFPHGLLGAEAQTTRIEALLALGDKQRALALLDGAIVKSDLAVTRGELRLEARRYEDAKRDFDSALIGANDELEQRALFGRAACRVHLGDDSGAKQDLEEYLRRFPNGRSAVAAKRALGR